MQIVARCSEVSGMMHMVGTLDTIGSRIDDRLVAVQS